MTFKEQIVSEIIPAIERMLEKEKTHLEYLNKHKRLQITAPFIHCCQESIKMLTVRLRQYKEYAGVELTGNTSTHPINSKDSCNGQNIFDLKQSYTIFD